MATQNFKYSEILLLTAYFDYLAFTFLILEPEPSEKARNGRLRFRGSALLRAAHCTPHCSIVQQVQVAPMPSSLTSDALNTISTEESRHIQSPPSSCGSDDQEEVEHLAVADTVLNDDNWSWLRDLLDLVRDAAVRSQGKVFFARLFKTQDATEMEATLSEMESWRGGLGTKSSRPREHELARALFLLGYDKNMSLAK